MHMLNTLTNARACTHTLVGSGWGNNAVWDEALKWCFQLLDCSCGKMAGIKIFHSTDRPDLKNTVSSCYL